ncbi:MAG: ABC transporter ATP-binding protein [Planctomycetota bacterium]
MNNDAPIRIRGLEVRYGKRSVLSGLDLDIPPGTTLALLGENGAGKSTLLKACLGLRKPKSGTVRVLGLNPVRRPAKVQRQVGYVPDRPDVYPWMSPSELMRFLAPHYSSWDASRARELLEQLRVPQARAFRQLSRGEGMKAMLAAALVPRPTVLLLDEPFGGLDPLVKDEVLRAVLEVLGERKPTVLMATHDLEIALRAADRIAVLAGGRIAREGTPEEIADRRTNEAVHPKDLHRVLAKTREASHR